MSHDLSSTGTKAYGGDRRLCGAEQAAIEKVREYQEDGFDGIEVLDDLGKPISIDGFPANVKTPR